MTSHGFSSTVAGTLRQALAMARRQGRPALDVEHILLVLIGPGEVRIPALLERLQVDPAALGRRLAAAAITTPASGVPDSDPARAGITARAGRVITAAGLLASKWGGILGPEQLLLGVLSLESDPAARILRDAGVTAAKVAAALHGILPLLPPPGGRQEPEGDHSGNGLFYVAARLTTSLDLPAVAQHYESQLEAAGWTRAGAGQVPPSAWSTWTQGDPDAAPRQALLHIFARPDQPGQYLIALRAEWPGTSDPDAGREGRDGIWTVDIGRSDLGATG